jgi:hypothetical protein
MGYFMSPNRCAKAMNATKPCATADVAAGSLTNRTETPAILNVLPPFLLVHSLQTRRRSFRRLRTLKKQFPISNVRIELEWDEHSLFPEKQLKK